MSTVCHDPMGGLAPELWTHIADYLVSDLKTITCLSACNWVIREICRLRFAKAVDCIVVATKGGSFDIDLRMTRNQTTSQNNTVAATLNAANLAGAVRSVLYNAPQSIKMVAFVGSVRPDVFRAFESVDLPNAERLKLCGLLPVSPDFHHVVHALSSVKEIFLNKLPASADFSRFWPFINTCTTLEAVQLLGAANLHHEDRQKLQSLQLPVSLRSLVIEDDGAMDGCRDIADLLTAAPWTNLQIVNSSTKDRVLLPINNNPCISRFRPLHSLRHFVYQSDNFGLNPIMNFVSCTPNLRRLTWNGLGECAAPILVVRLLRQLASRNNAVTRPQFVLAGATVCCAGRQFRHHGLIEIKRRLPEAVVQDISDDSDRVAKELLEAGECQEIRVNMVADAVIVSVKNLQVFYIRIAVS